jgi:hypothetical protein
MKLLFLFMREALGAGRGVQADEVEIPVMAAERRGEERRGREQKTMRRATDATEHKHKIASAYGYATQHT